jgi:predicted dehydrogenase
MKTVNLIGAGLIGQERLKAVSKLRARGVPIRIGWVHDPYNPRLPELSAEHQFKVEPQIERFLSQRADLVVVACPHDVATVQTCRALEAGHLVLLEKPLGRNLQETNLIATAAKSGRGLFIGLNYRFMPGVSALAADWRAGRFGTLFSLRMQIGHGGKPSDEKTWKLDPVRCGGGALLDPGIHLLDLCSVLAGSEPEIREMASWQGFWKTGIEEDVQLMLRCGAINISLEISVVRWRSHFEIFALGTEGYGQVTGRGRSYGRQYYRRGRRWGWQSACNQAASEELIVDDACEDSFADELAACLDFPSTNAIRPADLTDGLRIMKLYQAIKARLA